MSITSLPSSNIILPSSQIIPGAIIVDNSTTSTGSTAWNRIVYATSDYESGLDEEKKHAMDSYVKLAAKWGKGETGINPRLYFKYVKTKFTKVAQKRVDARLNQLKKILLTCEETNQRALFEAAALELSRCLQETKAIGVLGEDLKTIPKTTVMTMIEKIRDKVIKTGPLESFPRIVPPKVRKLVASLKKAAVFDEYFIVYVDYTKAPPLKTTAQKIREKDPILFGVLKSNPDNLYFLAEWIDEYCDLSLDKLIEESGSKMEEVVGTIHRDLTLEDLKGIVERSKERAKRLAETEISSWKEKLKAEQEEAKKPLLPPAAPVEPFIPPVVTGWRRVIRAITGI